MAILKTRAHWVKGAEIATNSLDIAQDVLISITSGFATNAVATGKVVGISRQTKVFEADNQTVLQEKLTYNGLDENGEFDEIVSNGTIAQANVNTGFNLTGASTAQVNTLTPTVVAEDAIQTDTVTINGVAYEFTSDATPTATEIVTGLKSLINAWTEPVTATGTVTLILTADTAGVPFTTVASANLANVATQANVTLGTVDADTAGSGTQVKLMKVVNTLKGRFIAL